MTKKDEKKIEGKSNAGRKPLFDKPEELKTLMDDYFLSITISTPRTQSVKIGEKQRKDKKGNDMFDPDGNKMMEGIYEDQPCLSNLGEQIIDTEFIEIPSILGMCEYMGIHRETLLNYEEKEEFFDTIKKAKLKIEKYNESQLYRTTQVTGIIFNLKNNFGWVDKSEVDNSGKITTEVIVGLPEEEGDEE